jgi:DNA polymerase-3 subunit delta
MLIRYTDFEASLTKRKFHANYFLFGADSFLIELAMKALTRALEESSEGQIVLVTLDLDETPVEEFVNTAQSLSMFAPRQLLVVKGAMKLREHQGKRLAPYFSNPNPQTVALFLAGDLDKDQKKKKIFEILSSATHVLELAPLEPREVAAWMQHQAKARDCTVEPDAIRFLLICRDRSRTIATGNGEGGALHGSEKRITVSVVEAVSGLPRATTV